MTVILGIMFVFMACGDDEENVYSGYTDVKGEWIAAQDFIGELRYDEQRGEWLFVSTEDDRNPFGLEDSQEAVVGIYNWRDEFAVMANGCRINGYYRQTGVETYHGSLAETIYITLRIDRIVVYPEPEPVEPDMSGMYPFIAGQLVINTAGGAAITSKEDYVEATFSLSHSCPEWDMEEVSGGIRGRGNSTWLWYPKKPYRIKFDKKQSLLGLPKAKSWVLLAEYRDPTKLMNAFVFELGNLMGLPYTNHNRYVEVVLNGKPQGLYHLTEQVQQNENRVNIDETEGILMQLDRDDGPELAPDAADNFWSAVYSMPVCVKNPDEPSATQLDMVKEALRPLEEAVNACDYTRVDELLDIRSMIDFLIVQELVYNVELDAPRSMYMHKDIGGDKWHMGPLWDFDAGFDFDWTNMTTSHNYFSDYRELVLGTRPATHAGTQYRVPGFFSDMFKMPAFVTAYKARWIEIKPMIDIAMTTAVKYYQTNGQLWYDDSQLWPIGKSSSTEISRMRTWLRNRADYLDGIVAGY